MFDALKRLLAGTAAAPAAGPLAGRLEHYPPHQLPHRGPGWRLSAKSAKDNLAYFDAVLPQRITQLSELLHEAAGIDTAPALTSPRVQGPGLAEAVSDWAGQTWPALHDPGRATLEAWYASSRAGADIAFSLALDVAMLLGEVIRRGNPDWRWALDLDRSNLRDKMTSAHRVVLLADPVGAAKYPFIIDPEDVVVDRLRRPDSPDYRHPALNPWLRMVNEGLRGDAMAYWRQAGS